MQNKLEFLSMSQIIFLLQTIRVLSVHKQQDGFSQTSQIHKKDKYINGQARYVNHKRMNNVFMMQASTCPFYPLFAALDVNARMHEGESGKRRWMACVKLGIETRKQLLKLCQPCRKLLMAVGGRRSIPTKWPMICASLPLLRGNVGTPLRATLNINILSPPAN